MYNGNFNYEILISKYSIYGVILISLQQIFYIISNKKSSNILSIEVVNYLRVIIVSLLCYFQFLEVPSIEKYILILQVLRTEMRGVEFSERKKNFWNMHHVSLKCLLFPLHQREIISIKLYSAQPL